MIWINSVTNAIYTILSSDSGIISSKITVGLYQSFNTLRNLVPWVNIMSPTVNINPRRSNVTIPWMAEYSVPIVVQALNGRNRQLGQITTDETVTKVMTAVNCNRDLLNQVCNLTGASIVPYDQENWGRQDYIEDTFFQYLITLNAEELS